MQKNLWRIASRCFDGYGHVCSHLIRVKYGLPERRATIPKEATLLSSEELAHPDRFLKRFSVRAEENPDLSIDRVVPGEVSFSFASPYDSGIPRNDRVSATLYREIPQSGRVIIVVGGLFSSANWYTRMIARRFAGELFDCCEMTLPLHGTRAAYGMAGLGWLAPDPIVAVESFVQSVCDLNRLYEVLRGRFRYEELFVAGMSVGGSIACISALTKEYGGVSLFMSGTSPAEIFWHSPSPYLRTLRHSAEEAGYTLEDVQRYWTISDVSKFDARPRSRKFLMMNGEFDTVTKPRYAHRLLNVLPGCAMITYPASHYSSICFLKEWARKSREFFLA